MIALATDDDGSEETSYGTDHYVPITDCSTHKKKFASIIVTNEIVTRKYIYNLMKSYYLLVTKVNYTHKILFDRLPKTTRLYPTGYWPRICLRKCNLWTRPLQTICINLLLVTVLLGRHGDPTTTMRY